VKGGLWENTEQMLALYIFIFDAKKKQILHKPFLAKEIHPQPTGGKNFHVPENCPSPTVP